MASIIDSFNDTFADHNVALKIIIYAIPIYFMLYYYTLGNSAMLSFLGAICAIFYLSLISIGIYNVRRSKNHILEFNPLAIIMSAIKSAIVLIPHILLFIVLGGFIINKIDIPVNIEHFNTIVKTILFVLLGSIVLTAFLSFSKNQDIIQGFNFKVISESCVEILISTLLYVPQILIVNAILLGPFAYLYYFFLHIPFTHWTFLIFVALAGVINISIFINFFAQLSYEQIKGNNAEYKDNMLLHDDEIAEEAATR